MGRVLDPRPAAVALGVPEGREPGGVLAGRLAEEDDRPWGDCTLVHDPRASREEAEEGGDEDNDHDVGDQERQACGHLCRLDHPAEVYETQHAQQAREAQHERRPRAACYEEDEGGHGERVGPEPTGLALLAERDGAIAPRDGPEVLLPKTVALGVQRVAVGGEELHDDVEREGDVQEVDGQALQGRVQLRQGDIHGHEVRPSAEQQRRQGVPREVHLGRAGPPLRHEHQLAPAVRGSPRGLCCSSSAELRILEEPLRLILLPAGVVST
mmetsp:Transcript_58084/g.180459  ORF Transcript_58084/g.180459 Transcript_58084/m.180459 type:complete len:269 (+) Transcript_58084:1355-2161(+)